MKLCENLLVLLAILLLLTVTSCYAQNPKSVQLFEYKYIDCDKSHEIKRYHLNDSVFVDSSFVRNIKALYTFSKTYKKVGQEWFYKSDDGTYLPWFSLDKYQKGDTLFFYRVPLSKRRLQPAIVAIPQRQEVYNNKTVYVYHVEEPNETPRIKPLEYYFDFDIGVVKIFDNQELEGCKEAQLVLKE